MTLGLTKNQKKTATSSSRLAAVVSITAMSLAKTESRTTKGPVRSAMAISGEAVADPAHRPDERPAPVIVTQLLPKAADEDVDRPVIRLRVEPAHGLHDPIARQHAAAIANEKAQQLELGGRQRQCLPLDRCRARR